MNKTLCFTVCRENQNLFITKLNSLTLVNIFEDKLNTCFYHASAVHLIATIDIICMDQGLNFRFLTFPLFVGLEFVGIKCVNLTTRPLDKKKKTHFGFDLIRSL